VAIRKMIVVRNALFIRALPDRVLLFPLEVKSIEHL
jgi:hypothetical protein